MNFPFEFSAAYTSPTPVIKKPFDDTDNLILLGLTSTQAALSLIKPSGPYWLTSFFVTADLACKVELGHLNENGTWLETLYTTFATYSAGGGVPREFHQAGPVFLEDSDADITGIRITGAASNTIRIAGDLAFSLR